MIKLYEFVYGVAFTIILGTALCADSLAAYPYGFRIMFVCIGVAVVLAVLGGRLRERDERIKKSRPQRWSSDRRRDQRKR